MNLFKIEYMTNDGKKEVEISARTPDMAIEKLKNTETEGHVIVSVWKLVGITDDRYNHLIKGKPRQKREQEQVTIEQVIVRKLYFKQDGTSITSIASTKE